MASANRGIQIGSAWFQRKVNLRPQHRGVHLVTEEILKQMPEISQFSVGLFHVQILHTSASLALNESWDPDVRDDMEMMLNKIVPEGLPYRHSCEGPDDMPAHVKACFLGSSLTIPITDGKLNLGTWQGIWLCEHRDQAGSRKENTNKTCDCDGTTQDPIEAVIPILGLPSMNNGWMDLERESYWNMRLWHVIFIFLSGFSSVVVLLCCCIKFRIPRTKQEIEADYIRKKITRKFTKQLKMIHNSDMDEMDLKKALDKIRSEFKSETESIIMQPENVVDDQEETLESGSYRKASDIGVDIEELIERGGSGIGSKFSKMVGSVKILKSRKSSSDQESSIP